MQGCLPPPSARRNARSALPSIAFIITRTTGQAVDDRRSPETPLGRIVLQLYFVNERRADYERNLSDFIIFMRLRVVTYFVFKTIFQYN
jgi:hypothetical protein